MAKLHKSLGYAALFTLLISALACIKASFIIGSQTGAFSFAHILSPLIGLFGGGIGVVALLALRTALRLSWSTGTTNILLACHLPTFFAGMYFSITKQNSRFSPVFAALVPLACIIIFCIHPVGNQAWLYSCLWLLPLATASIPHKNLFFHALGSTFTAHAVGSVLWLYLGLVTEPTAWLALIPIVLCERLLFSTGMVICHNAIINTQAKLSAAFTATHLKNTGEKTAFNN
jgi:hypothetical protein